MNGFKLGCNYWASNAGTEMWNKWDKNAVEEDMKILAAHGVRYLRVFPNWRDFQPIIPILKIYGEVSEYLLEGDKQPENEYFLDEDMLCRFEEFCGICSSYGMKLIVGLLTGWMSGRTFIPSALYGKNLFTDPTALLFEQRFIRGFVKRFKENRAIEAWDLGNECNCMSVCENHFVAENWTSVVSNAIKAEDSSHPVISGMHSLSADRENAVWTIRGQGEFCDILTTHPYPYWVSHMNSGRLASFRTSIHATCETKLYSDISGRPCLVEEVGTLGPMLASDEKAADFLRCNLFSNFANGAEGVLWWCANEQTNLDSIPYTRNMCEVELGMIDAKRNPRPVLKEMKRFGDLISSLGFELPRATEDAVCILTKSQDQWAVGYMTYGLAKQANLNLRFSYCDGVIPDGSVYMLPSLSEHLVMNAEKYDELKKRVCDGATLYISNDNGILSGFEELCGLMVTDSLIDGKERYVEAFDGKIRFSGKRIFELESTGAEVLLRDNTGNIVLAKHGFGKGTVYYLNFPLEAMLIDDNDAFDGEYYKLYERIFENVISKKKIISENKYIAVTEHPEGRRTYCAAINHSAEAQSPEFEIKGKIGKVYYGNISKIEAFDCVIFDIEEDY